MTVHTLNIPKREKPRVHSGPRYNRDVCVMFGDTMTVTVPVRRDHVVFFAGVKAVAEKHVKDGSPLSGGTL